MKIKELSPFVLTRHGAKKGTDRFYPSLDALFPPKKMVVCQFFNLYLYIKTPATVIAGA
ncbi:hypothetical protein [Bacillus sp. TL12]|uniref:hypothetical protein n=1 Tax=Bacillus sp. TL12 TaxID=2894756 RepID=UPI001F524CAC|nr:hypothetical protein [Bacillus sp. TL12]MCI0766750.1 hypothetical protein [Bacillus sp. TL12]